jgi:Polyketide cyclase / dehydrase and lipid transport
MGKIEVSEQRRIGAPADVVYRSIADDAEHVKFLPPAFSDFRVESGGVGAGTIHRFKVTAGGRTRDYRMKVDEPEPGRVLTESDTGSSLVTTFIVDPEGDHARVRISTSWDGAGGIGGFFERLFAPRVMRGIYADELDRLDAYVRGRSAG